VELAEFSWNRYGTISEEAKCRQCTAKLGHFSVSVYISPKPHLKMDSTGFPTLSSRPTSTSDPGCIPDRPEIELDRSEVVLPSRSVGMVLSIFVVF